MITNLNNFLYISEGISFLKALEDLGSRLKEREDLETQITFNQNKNKSDSRKNLPKKNNDMMSQIYPSTQTRKERAGSFYQSL